MTLVYLAAAWTAGIIIADRLQPDAAFMLILPGFALLALLINRKNAGARLIFGLLLAAGLGMLRFDAARPESDAAHVMQLNDLGQLTIRGVIISEPVRQDAGLQIVIAAEEAAGHPVHGRVLVRAPRSSDLAYGDEVQVFGFLRSPAEFDTFSYRDYLARQKVFSVMYNADAEILARDQGNPFYAALLVVKDRARRFITRSLPEPQASLLVGILLGDESGLSDDTREAFSLTGTSHVIAISGFNMVILAQLIMLILRRFLEARKAAAAGIIAIAIYTIFVGAGGAVVRAAVMSGLLIVGQALYRKTYVPASLAFSVIFLSALDPWALWDVGFQLSLAAVIGMALFVNPIEKAVSSGLQKITSSENAQRIMGVLSDALIVTLAAQITTTPLILYYFGRLSLVSLPVNFLIIPAQTPLLLFGALGTGIGLVIPAFGEVILQVAWVFLTWNVELVRYFADVSWAGQDIALSQETVLAFFAVLGLVMWYQALRPRWAMRLLQRSQIPVRFVQVGGVIVLILLGYAITQKPDGRLHMTFLDTGGVIIESPDGGVILVDGGTFPTRLLDALGDALPARSRHLDVLIITTPEEDTIAALPELLERYSLGALVTNGESSNAPSFVALMNQTEANAIPVVHVSAGYTLTTDDGLTLEIVNPPLLPEGDESFRGLVIRVTYGEAVFLLTGNIEADTEAVLLRNPHLVQANVLQIPAQGSGDSSSAAFVNVVHPQVAILQHDPAQADDPSPNVIARFDGIPLFRTDTHGTIEIMSDGDQIWVETEN